ncbi:J domain-containing protein [Clostridium botulinum]|uniref:J domain-containing protein n=1 Tax=Clostridium botulinum TaxID=1491 RepID=UPI0004D51FCA|nr:DnaJ domain-containing protein [Clostridium botulinum]KEI06656.1 molecular chaperone DnaJ [Clostridium botulinum C/D str. BKT75002]KEI09568.1 molecular chaperone DnaJ [Clostridium botulinum C/D str. BKT2873]QPW60169.1 DnaJ domain-containing protein [Clostridium botulinum]
MRNPYEVLEINENATEEEIKQAYRKLARKYHPDQYGDNPLRDLAEDKMRELNEAYDYLTKNHVNHNSNNQNSDFGNFTKSMSFDEIRIYINKGDLVYAESQLHNITDHNAEWNYLMGVINLQKGWYDAAFNYISIACRLNPYNNEYTNTLRMLQNKNQSFRQEYNNTRGNNSDFCDCCAKLWCLDCLCNCCCNVDLISC